MKSLTLTEDEKTIIVPEDTWSNYTEFDQDPSSKQPTIYQTLLALINIKERIYGPLPVTKKEISGIVPRERYNLFPNWNEDVMFLYIYLVNTRLKV